MTSKRTSQPLGVFILATKDDFCLEHTIRRLLEERVDAIFVFTPTHYWTGEEVPQTDVDEVGHIITNLIADVKVTHQRVNCQPMVSEWTDRIKVETEVRNRCIDRIRREGFDHILIVDGDELWRRGAVDWVRDYVSDHRPQALALGMVPVAGVPGYAIDSAKDNAMVYLAPGVKLVNCRGVDDEVHTHNGVRAIIHFTATRKTLDEVIDKHRKSGHYGDPSYDFEGWIDNVLPHIHAGMRNIHMYTGFQIWPVARHFTPEEVADIPVDLHPYLHPNLPFHG